MTSGGSIAPLARCTLALLTLLFMLPPSPAQEVSAEALVVQLRQGGDVLLMRHANSPRTPPEAAQANPDNPQHERQLDAQGRAAAIAMGAAFSQMSVKVGLLLSSPTYRALETIRLARLGPARTAEALGDAGQSMQADTGGARAAWIRAQVAEVPAAGTNTVMVTHYPNITEAYPQEAAGLAEGEALIFRPDGHGGARFVGRVKMEDWPRLAAMH